MLRVSDSVTVRIEGLSSNVTKVTVYVVLPDVSNFIIQYKVSRPGGKSAKLDEYNREP